MKVTLPDVTNSTGLVSKIDGLVFDVNAILQEYYSTCRAHLKDCVGTNAVLVQRKFHVMLENEMSSNIDIARIQYINAVIHKVRKLFEFNSVNFREIMPNTAYNWHTDIGKRCIHIPLITNNGCLFVYENTAFKMPADGSVYFVNNEKFHTFVNAGSSSRLHLTFETL